MSGYAASEASLLPPRGILSCLHVALSLHPRGIFSCLHVEAALSVPLNGAEAALHIQKMYRGSVARRITARTTPRPAPPRHDTTPCHTRTHHGPPQMRMFMALWRFS